MGIAQCIHTASGCFAHNTLRTLRSSCTHRTHIRVRRSACRNRKPSAETARGKVNAEKPFQNTERLSEYNKNPSSEKEKNGEK